MPSPFTLSFELRPLDDVVPWTDASGDYLRWFGLTDGTYDIRIEDQSIFEYTDAALVHFGVDRPDVAGVDYQVARLFQDLCSVLGDVLDEPIPTQVHEVIANLETLTNLLGTNWRATREQSALADVGLGWLFTRSIDSAHFVKGPDLYLWRHHDRVFVWCNSDHKVIDGQKVWAHAPLFTSMPVAAFEQEVLAFQQRLLQQMSERIQQIEAGGLASSIRIDLDQIRQDHEAGRAMAQERRAQPPPDWPGVAQALSELIASLS